MKLYLDIRNFTKARISKSELKRIALRTLGMLGVKERIGVSLAIVGVKRIKNLNKKYRGVDRVTDVLAFGENSTKKDKFVEPPDKVERLGEIIICLALAKKRAKSFGHSLKKELATLFVHGILHLLGWEDKIQKERKEMEKIEERILKSVETKFQ